jgi:PPOX class probable F420-dependent enzyme
VVQGEAARALEGRPYLSVTTYKRDGRGVATLVWFVVDEGMIYFRTPRAAGKVKRIRANRQVLFFGCDRDGRRIGPTFRGQARIMDAVERNRPHVKLHKKYGIVSRLFALTFVLPGRREAFVEITPADPSSTP